MTCIEIVASLWVMVALGMWLFTGMLAVRAILGGGADRSHWCWQTALNLTLGLLIIGLCWPFTLGKLLDALEDQG